MLQKLTSKTLVIICILLMGLTSCKNKQSKGAEEPEQMSGIISNPIVEGYYADPSVINHDDKFYIYSTIDPWGGDSLAVHETKDFKTFKKHKLNWPTKEACTSDTSTESMVWAPGVTRAPNGNYYMYISVGGEIWVGVSENPLGPWKNAKPDNTPLIKKTLYPEYHMIDAMCFIDDDNQAYLYWGSGLHWVNGRCFAVKLNKDMISFDGEIKNVTPENYFEAPFMLKREGKYYLMYSDGKAIDSTYKIRYSVGKSPFGPFTEGKNSPIATTNTNKEIYGPGHNSVLKENGQHYLLYHQIHPQEDDYVLRQLRIDSLKFNKNGDIEKIDFEGIREFGH